MDDAAVLDRMRIWHLLNVWAYARDNAEWDMLRDCFCSDARMNISWIQGTAAAFVAGSVAMTAGLRPGTYHKHLITSPVVLVGGARATSVCHVVLESRTEIDGHAVDIRGWFRFFDLLRKEADGRWRIYDRTAVYEKDHIALVDPRGAADALFADMDLSRFAAPIKYRSWVAARAGGTPRTDVVCVGSPEEAALKRTAAAWLRGEPA